jgi:alkaline phosphatase D
MSHLRPASPVPAGITRRSMLAATLVGAAAGTRLGGSGAQAAAPPRGPVFTLGVASGDPAHDSVVLWTRLAREPLARDGYGGMPNLAVPVDWEIAHDPAFRSVARRGRTHALPEEGHSVHVEVDGLRPGAEYHYRFRVGREISPPGRTRTAPAPGTWGRPLRMSVTSCSDFQTGYFTAFRRMVEDSPDLVVFLGDYIYEYGDYSKNRVRDQVGKECHTLGDYRLRYAQHHTDPDLQAAHAAAPWAVVFDDHEIENGWVGNHRPGKDPAFLARRAAALQALWENLPMRRSARPTGPAMRLYRRLHWGALANVHLLDTRQYRDLYACGGVVTSLPRDCPERFTVTRTIMGAAQEAWLARGLAGSSARWDVLAQQAFFMQMDWTADEVGYSNESWDGYVASRDRVVGALDRYTRNAVVLTGDVHAHWAGEIRRDFDRPGSGSAAVELVTSSVSSGGDGADRSPHSDAHVARNPHLKFYNGRRGWVNAVLTPGEMRVDFRSLPAVTWPGARPYTSGSFVVADESPRCHRA